MLANRTALAIPAFVDLFTRYLRRFAISPLLGRNPEFVERNRPSRRPTVSNRNADSLPAARLRFGRGHDGERRGHRHQDEDNNHQQTEHDSSRFLRIQRGTEQGLRAIKAMAITRWQGVIPGRLQGPGEMMVLPRRESHRPSCSEVDDCDDFSFLQYFRTSFV